MWFAETTDPLHSENCIRKIVRFDLAVLNSLRANLLARDPTGIIQHHQQVPSVQHIQVVVPDPRAFKENERICDAIKPWATLKIRITFTTGQLKYVDHSFMKDWRAYQPAASRRKTFGLNRAREECFMIDVISIIRLASLFIQARCVSSTQFITQEFHQQTSFLRTWLCGIIGWHQPK